MNPVHSFRNGIVMVASLLVVVTLTVSIGLALVGTTVSGAHWTTGGAYWSDGSIWSD